MSKPREVFIDATPRVIWVRYVKRKKYQRWGPAQFDPRVATVEEARQWVLDRPNKFILVEKSE